MTTRRHWLLSSAAALALPIARAAEPPASEQAASRHFPMGPVVPARPLDRWPVTTQLGVATDLPALLRGKVSALQLMFTGCSATCPIQGALFAQAQRQVGDAPGRVQFVSLSIDPLGDTPEALRAWLQRQSAGPQWLGAVPRLADVAAIVERLGLGGATLPPGQDRHATQVYVFNDRAELVWRTAPLPAVERIVEAVRQVAATVPRPPGAAGLAGPVSTRSPAGR